MTSIPRKRATWLAAIATPPAAPQATPDDRPKRPSLARIRRDIWFPDDWYKNFCDWLEQKAHKETPAEKARRLRLKPWETSPPVSEKARRVYSAMARDTRLEPVAHTLFALEAYLEPPSPQLPESALERLRELPLEERLARYAELVRTEFQTTAHTGLVFPFLALTVELAVRARYPSKFANKNQRLKALSRASADFLKAVRDERIDVERYLAGTGLKPNDDTPHVDTGYDKLVHAVEVVYKGANSGRSTSDWYDYVFDRSRKVKTPDGATRYFLRGAVACATHYFKRPLHNEAGILAAVCLRLQEPISASDVKELSRPVR